MNIKRHSEPAMLERYAFLWSEARLVLAAVALVIGGIPVIWILVPVPLFFPLVTAGLTLAWVISGVASAYLLYRWNAHKHLFGSKHSKDTWAFFVSIVSGVNLGLAGIFGRNIGMSIASGRFIFFIVGIVYLLSAWHLWKRWKASGEKIF